MSDLSVLSHEYKTAADFSKEINEALILLKKIWLGLSDTGEVGTDEVEQVRQSLARILQGLIALLAPAASRPEELKDIMRIPGSVISKLREERGGDLEYYLEDIKHTAAVLDDPRLELTEQDFALLDHLAAAADAQSSYLFRRLMRK